MRGEKSSIIYGEVINIPPLLNIKPNWPFFDRVRKLNELFNRNKFCVLLCYNVSLQVKQINLKKKYQFISNLFNFFRIYKKVPIVGKGGCTMKIITLVTIVNSNKVTSGTSKILVFFLTNKQYILFIVAHQFETTSQAFRNCSNSINR